MKNQISNHSPCKGINHAAKFMLESLANDQFPSVTKLENIIEAFLESRSDRRDTTLRDLKIRMRSVSVRPKRGYHALSPKQSWLKNSLQSTGGEESKTIEINSYSRRKRSFTRRERGG